VALTTEAATKLSSNVVTDVNANVPAAPAAPRTVSPEVALLFDKSVVARPLMVPEVCSLRVKNTEYRYRWVNRDGQGGRIYSQRRSQGFINATHDDVEVLAGDAYDKDGEIRAGDLILMKIRADLYDSAIKWNMQKAHTFANMRGVSLEGASSNVFADDKPRRASISEEPFAKKGLAEPFIPSQSSVEAMIGESIKSGRVNETRATVEELRQKGAVNKAEV
jgi:hypothetical protein